MSDLAQCSMFIQSH